MRKREVEHGRVDADLPARAVGVGHDEDSAYDFGRPAESLRSELAADKALLLVELPNRLFEPDEFRLDLLDDHRAPVSSSPEDIDRAALAVHRIADLDADIPLRLGEAGDRRRNQASVALVDQVIESGASPQDAAVEPRTDRGEDPPYRRERGRVDPTAFDRRDQRLRYPRRPRDIYLTFPRMDAKSPQRRADLDVVHPAIIAGRARLLVIWRSPRALLALIHGLPPDGATGVHESPSHASQGRRQATNRDGRGDQPTGRDRPSPCTPRSLRCRHRLRASQTSARAVITPIRGAPAGHRSRTSAHTALPTNVAGMIEAMGSRTGWTGTRWRLRRPGWRSRPTGAARAADAVRRSLPYPARAASSRSRISRVTPSTGTRSCVIESRSRTVTAPSSSESTSTVTHHGVPISSWRR